MPKLQRFALALVFCIISAPGFSRVNGPLIIDFIGFDAKTYSISFTRTDWSECDCATELYTYYMDSDSLVIDSEWSPRNDFSENRNNILEAKGLARLPQLNSTDFPDFISFDWEPGVSYYSRITEAETVSYPFTISIFGFEYHYYQCRKESGEPNVINLRIDAYSGLVFINFQGDCLEGNWEDSLIYYSKKGGVEFSKRLTPDRLVPLEFYGMKQE